MPNSSLFRTDEFWDIVLSDVGLLSMMGLVYKLGKVYGFTTMLWTYVLPLMWVNHWIVMITYLHHTHTALPKYTPESWTYLRGALATVDRDPGFVMRHSKQATFRLFFYLTCQLLLESRGLSGRHQESLAVEILS